MIKKKEKGFALIMALVLLLVMSLMGGGLIVVTSGDHQSNNTSDQYQQAFYVAETALIEAEKTIVNQYLGPWMKVSDIPAPDGGASPEEIAAHAALVAKANSSATEGGFFRNTAGRSMPTNVIDMSTDTHDTPCYRSFRNIHRTNFRTTHHITEQNFGELIEPIFDKLQFAQADDPGTTEDESTEDDDTWDREGKEPETLEEQIEKEKNYMKRYHFEYFMVNVGSAPYKGTGSSIKKSASDSADNMGTAYKIYGCGIFLERGNTPDTTKPQIIIPLESVIVMPN